MTIRHGVDGWGLEVYAVSEIDRGKGCTDYVARFLYERVNPATKKPEKHIMERTLFTSHRKEKQDD